LSREGPGEPGPSFLAADLLDVIVEPTDTGRRLERRPLLSASKVSHEVPAGLEEEARAFVDVLRESQGLDVADASLIAPEARGIGVDVVLPAVLLVSSTALTTVTKGWVDEYLWPELNRRIEKPSERFVKWLLDTVLPQDSP
jgi:hypothetical protein